MNVFFEESGDFKVGSVLSQAGEAYQVEMASGKRNKVKTKDVMLQFDKPSPAELMEQAKAIAADVDLDFLWEVAGEEEFGFAELGAEYFGHAPQPAEAAGLILSLHAAPIYFHKKGRGRYKKAPEQTLKAALAGIEKKKQQAIIQGQYAEELKAGTLPASMQNIVNQLLFKPDKNTIEYKALEQAANEAHTTPARLMLSAGGIKSPKDLHMAKFLFENFPKGHGFPELPVPSAPANLPLAAVEAFSIDDVTTTEIDDAFSVVHQPDGRCASASTSPPLAWASSRTTPSTRLRAAACPRSICRATRSPCCPMRLSTPLPWPKARLARRCRYTPCSTRPTGR